MLIRAGEDMSSNPEYISGGYMFPFSGNIGNADFNTDHIADHHISPSNLVEVQLYTRGADGKLTEGIDVAIGQTLNLLAFTVPNKDVKQIEVEVYGSTTAGITKVWTKTLNTGGQTGTDGSLLAPGQIHKVTLGNLNDPGSNDYSSWMTTIPDNMPVTRMSIPGSDHAFSYNNNNNNSKFQDENIRAQFDAGVRAFRARIKLADGEDEHLPAGTGKKIMLTVTGSEDIMQLGDAVHLMHQEIQARSDREFVVFVLSDVYNPDGSTFIPAEYRESSDYGDYADYYEMLYKTLAGSIKKMDDLGICVPYNKIMEAVKGGSMTLGPLRGHILMSVVLNSEIGLAESIFSDESDNPYYLNSGDGDMNTRFCAINTGNPVDRKGYVGGAFAPWASVERWLSKDKDSYMINSISTNATTPAAQYPSGHGLDLWKHLEGVPALFTWYTRNSMTKAQIYPLVYGRMGSYNLAESPTKDAIYGYDNSLNAGDSESGVLLANPIADYVSGRKQYVTITNTGLAAINASVVMDNAKTYYNKLAENPASNFDRQGPLIGQFFKHDRSDYIARNSYYSCPGIDVTTLESNGYSAFPAGTNTPGTFWCVYGEISPVPLTSEFWTPTSNLTDKLGYASRINTRSWYTDPGALCQRYAAQDNVFVMTFLGMPATTYSYGTQYTMNSVVNASRYIIGNFLRSATISAKPMITYSSSTFAVDEYKCEHTTPLGIVFLPYIPNRSGIDTNNTWPNGAYSPTGDQKWVLYRHVRGIIRAMVEQTQKLAPKTS